jgi:hypothetical protein
MPQAEEQRLHNRTQRDGGLSPAQRCGETCVQKPRKTSSSPNAAVPHPMGMSSMR